MNTDPVLVELADAVRALRAEVARLTERVAALEGAPAAANPPSQPTQPAQPSQPAPPVQAADLIQPDQPGQVAGSEPAELSTEVLLAISAAVAAYLGKKPVIRHIRLAASPTWSYQGRVSIQGSHALAPHARTGAGS